MFVALPSCLFTSIWPVHNAHIFLISTHQCRITTSSLQPVPICCISVRCRTSADQHTFHHHKVHSYFVVFPMFTVAEIKDICLQKCILNVHVYSIFMLQVRDVCQGPAGIVLAHVRLVWMRPGQRTVNSIMPWKRKHFNCVTFDAGFHLTLSIDC